MPEFVAETYAPRDVPGAADIALAAGRTSQGGGAVCFLGATLVPGEETCLWRYQAPSAGVVRLAVIRARLRPGRITLVVPAGPPDARPDPASAVGGLPSDEQVMTSVAGPARRCRQADTNRVSGEADLRGVVRQAGRSWSISAGYSDRKGD